MKPESSKNLGESEAIADDVDVPKRISAPVEIAPTSSTESWRPPPESSMRPTRARRTSRKDQETSTGARKSTTKLGHIRTPWWQRATEKLIAMLATSAILAVVAIFVFVLREAWPLLVDDDALGPQGGLQSLFRAHRWPGYDEPLHVWQPVGFPGKLDVIPLVVGTLKVTGLTMLIAIPLGIGGAIFLAEVAPRRLREWLKPAVEMLAAVPSVVVGFFVLAILAGGVQRAFDLTYRLNALVAAIGLAFAVVPVVLTITEDALRTVPRELVEASLALGARRWQTTLGVTLPAAMPGIAAAVVLGFGRAIGETMIVLMASGNAPMMGLDPTSSARTLTATIAAELGEVAPGSDHWRVLFLLGALLFVVTFVLNEVGRWVVLRLRRKLRAEEVAPATPVVGRATAAEVTP